MFTWVPGCGCAGVYYVSTMHASHTKPDIAASIAIKIEPMTHQGIKTLGWLVSSVSMIVGGVGPLVSKVVAAWWET
jgi:hypothetical protein